MSFRHFALVALLAGNLPLATAGTLIELSAEASRPAANDLIQAQVYAEANAGNPAEVARQVNRDLGEALQVIKKTSGVTVKSGNQNTYPIYGNGRRIEGWRMRADLLLESKDSAAISELLARLQQMKLALGNVSQMPSPATRKEVEAGVTRDAIRAFEAKAAVIAETLGKSYRIKRLSIQQSGFAQPMPMLRAARMEMASAMAPTPIEAGESQVSTTVSGEIELAD
ncbi:SIMPL domain-containing protein [Quatrionicoccus australiensis]|uniref:SIMPL domain-containing protein n=1 Tax=Quatrionicoccus australiensis TaxID=138118 RepID=UPI001CFACB12|nr:SIMPL domain-containing protein [Quatrionicoccus australiensis]MCB4359748.1 SIMPL domain-containing protein [Quatrionicoccus australiensis]